MNEYYAAPVTVWSPRALDRTPRRSAGRLLNVLMPRLRQHLETRVRVELLYRPSTLKALSIERVLMVLDSSSHSRTPGGACLRPRAYSSMSWVRRCSVSAASRPLLLLNGVRRVMLLLLLVMRQASLSTRSYASSPVAWTPKVSTEA
jgi:hypothetical protein